MATLEAGFYEASIALNHAQRHYNHSLFGYTITDIFDSGFKNDLDLNLYRRNGNLYRTLRDSRSEYIKPGLLEFFKNRLDSIDSKHILESIGPVKMGYFPKTHWHSSLVNALRDHELDLGELSPLSNYMAFHSDQKKMKDWLISHLDSPTLGCENFQKAIQSKRNSGFIGSRLSLEKNSPLPGIEGVGPGSRAVQPSLRPPKGF